MENTKTIINLANKREQIGTFIEICTRIRREGKGNRENFQTQSLFKYGYPVDFLLSFAFYQKGYTFLKHRELQAGVVVCKSFELDSTN